LYHRRRRGCDKLHCVRFHSLCLASPRLFKRYYFYHLWKVVSVLLEWLSEFWMVFVCLCYICCGYGHWAWGCSVPNNLYFIYTLLYDWNGCL